MNSVRRFAVHLNKGKKPFSDEMFCTIGAMDAHLLEGDLGYFNLVHFSDRHGAKLSNLVVLKGEVYFIDYFRLICVGNIARIHIYTQKIKVGSKISYEKDAIFIMDEVGQDMKLANCSRGTFKWLVNRPATQKIIDRLTKVT